MDFLENDIKANFQETIPRERGDWVQISLHLGDLKLPKMLAILFEILTIDDFQYDASDML